MSASYPLIVSRDGTIDFPQLGPIRVAGMRFPEAQALIEQRVNAELIGVRSSVSMGPLRSIRVFVLGDAERPGSYTVSGLSTITNALFVSGGIKTIGSLRRIELKRGGRTVRTLDLYDLLLKGDTRADERLQPGDAIFIPSVGPTVTVAGEVNRPAIYELKGSATAADVIALAGGMTPTRDPRLATVERIESSSNLRTVVNVDLLGAGRTTDLTNGDLMRVPSVTPTYSDSVWVRGHAFRTGPLQYRAGLRLTDVLRSVEDLRPNADLHYVLIRREDPRSRRDFRRLGRPPRGTCQPGIHRQRVSREPRRDLRVRCRRTARSGRVATDRRAPAAVRPGTTDARRRHRRQRQGRRASTRSKRG